MAFQILLSKKNRYFNPFGLFGFFLSISTTSFEKEFGLANIFEISEYCIFIGSDIQAGSNYM